MKIATSLANLYMVATPIGNLGDITQRALETLKQVDIIAAEDTRHSKRLLQHYLIDKPLVSFHEHSTEKELQKIINLLISGQSVAFISDAGTPLISDPGFRLVRAARKASIRVIPIPGASAVITALSAAGLPSDRFIFEGFLPVKKGARFNRLEPLQNEPRTMIFYESPHRIIGLLENFIEVFGKERHAVVARELTKKFETIHGDSLSELLLWMKENPEQQKGEFVVLVEGFPKKENAEIDDHDLYILKILLSELPTKQAAAIASKITGKKKNLFYEIALKN